MTKDLLDYIQELFQGINSNNSNETFRDKKIMDIEKVKLLIDGLKNIENKGFTIYFEQDSLDTAEIAIAEGSRVPNSINLGESIIKEDKENSLVYELSECSDLYVTWIYQEMFEQNIFKLRNARFNLRNRARMRAKRKESENISLFELMKWAIGGVYTLKIKKEQNSHIDLDEAINSYSYTYMCNMNRPIKIYDLKDIIGIGLRANREENKEFEVPKREYNKALIDYYNLAISSEDPFISFISYYHIIEYFYDEVFREHQIASLKKSITAPSFSYKNDDQLYSVIKKVLKDNKSVRENGSGNEQQSLNYVLSKYIEDTEEFTNKIPEESRKYYQNTNVSFSQGDKIVWNNPDGIITQVAKRIYKTRNALIHSKSSEKYVLYHPYLHKDELLKEIDLIKVIAENVIENSASYL